MSKVYIIAEAGVNHNGELNLALELIDLAKLSGADCIKFQTFKAENLVTKNAHKADYQKKTTDQNQSQFEMLKGLELTEKDFEQIKDYCKIKKIDFLSTPFDLESVDILHQLGIKKWKIPSGEITNLPYLIKLAKTDLPVILSTGMATLKEVENAINVLKNYGTKKLTLLHCTTEYPTPYEDVNLNAMLTMKNKFNLPVGYSDHTTGIEVAIAAVAMGATIIEKHFTLDRGMAGPDHKASLEPDELATMVKVIRHIEKAMGDGIKRPSASEKKNIGIVRKSIVAKERISKGELFTEKNLTVKRPGDGISPMKWFELMGKRATRDFEEDELVEL
ncbi:MAG: N,N-diacetyllegionaminate synthase [Bacteroidales bacterium]|jgi:N,N'-diacetyllegionaminate synthase|nr:N,N-diacetyllegionaminate synthase [Bacteroidales bacterium]